MGILPIGLQLSIDACLNYMKLFMIDSYQPSTPDIVEWRNSLVLYMEM